MTIPGAAQFIYRFIAKFCKIPIVYQRIKRRISQLPERLFLVFATKLIVVIFLSCYIAAYTEQLYKPSLTESPDFPRALQLASAPISNKNQHQSSTSCLVAEKRQNFSSLCSCESDNRGFNQNVIAFSLYGNFSDPRHYERYVNPMKSILETINQVYPGKLFQLLPPFDIPIEYLINKMGHWKVGSFASTRHSKTATDWEMEN